MSFKLSLVGYSGHALVVIESVMATGNKIHGYFDKEQKENLFDIDYLGKENRFTSDHNIFITIGDNGIREKVFKLLQDKNNLDIKIIDPSALISSSSEILHQVYVGKNTIINAGASIKEGCIINTNCIVEHGVHIGKFSHIAPSSTICGDVSIGSNCYIGANSTIIQGISIGNNVTVGAGSVVIKDLEPNSKYVGNPVRKL